MEILNKAKENIRPLNKDAINKAWSKIDNLTKPIGSLGKLEDIAAKVAGITGKIENDIDKKNIVIMCADNGVVEEGVSSNPQKTTAIVTNNFTKGITGVCALAKYEKSDITVVDIGVNANFSNPKIIDKKILYGTQNIAKGPAMSKKEAIKAIETGIEVVEKLVKCGYKIIGTGEMGVGNTTTAAAIASCILDVSADEIVGKGAGLTKDQYIHKKNIVKKAIDINKPCKDDVLDVLSKVGGLDIAGLCGCFIGASKNRVPIVIDGFISLVAALCAYKINPLSREYMFASHMSAESGARYVMKELGLHPMFDLKMRLGEGSGCPIAFNIIEAALYTINNMATFNEAALCKEDYIDIRKNEKKGDDFE